MSKTLYRLHGSRLVAESVPAYISHFAGWKINYNHGIGAAVGVPDENVEAAEACMLRLLRDEFPFASIEVSEDYRSHGLELYNPKGEHIEEPDGLLDRLTDIENKYDDKELVT